jgi:NAD(P)-dependent dehydrogenase (short-subunit alcohol dehydrogenase family)
MDARLTALVSGANRGIGLEVVRQLAMLGHTAILGSRDPDKGREAAARLSSSSQINGQVVPLQLDVTDQRSIEEAVAEIVRRFWRIDMLINNAAINYDTWQHGITADIDGSVRETFDTNLFGAWRLARAVIPIMRKQKFGRIVNVTSESGSLSSMGGGTPGYSTSKAALNALTRILAAEVRTHGILVNAVCPGWVATDMGGPGGRPVAEGAKGIVWAATLPKDGPSGGVFRDGQPIPW